MATASAGISTTHTDRQSRLPEALASDHLALREDHALLAGLMQEVERALHGDGLSVISHHEDDEPVVLFASERCLARPQIVEAMRSAAISVASASDSVPMMSRPYPHSSGGILGAAITVPAGRITITCAIHPPDEQAAAQRRETLSRMLPLVRPFFCLLAKGKAMQGQLSKMIVALNHTGVATFVVDADAKISFLNDAGERLVKQEEGITRRNSRLGAVELADTLKLQSAISRTCAAPPNSRSRTSLLSIRRGKRRPLIVSMAPAARWGVEANHAAVVNVFDPEQDLTSALEPACKLYGLSSIETKLTCRLAHGATLRDAAKVLGVQEQTARSYLKQVFLKTDTNRQAELVRLILKSVG